eukprot:4202302-Pyramimonas_sp.AAC.1
MEQRLLMAAAASREKERERLQEQKEREPSNQRPTHSWSLLPRSALHSEEGRFLVEGLGGELAPVLLAPQDKKRSLDCAKPERKGKAKKQKVTQ